MLSTGNRKHQIDHVTLGAFRLEALAGAFAAVGLAADYGGLRSYGVTHMSQVAFEDGSYVELVSVLRPGQPSPWWQQHIVHEGGPCAFLLGSRDLDASRQRCRLGEVQIWGDVSVAGFDGDALLGRWLGVVAI